MTEMEHVAWTGGTTHGKWKDITEAEQAYVHKLFENECGFWKGYWKTKNIPVNTRNIFWNRARLDAHATFRAAARNKT